MRTPLATPITPTPSPTIDYATNYGLLLTTIGELYQNGEDTSGCLRVAGQLQQRLGIAATLVPEWNSLLLQVDGELVRMMPVVPSGVNMGRVGAVLQVSEHIVASKLSEAAAPAALAAAGRVPESGLGLFVLACAVGAGALAIINGAVHPLAIGLIVGCAGLGALLRRGAAKWLGATIFLQDLIAAVLAGLVGAWGVRWQVSTEMRLMALGPLLVLVPGPTLLNGVFDLAALRLPLGLARVGFGLLTILAISTGVLVGLSLGGVTLPAAVTGRIVPLWLDVVCAGLAAACYGVFYSMPLRLLVYPVLVGMLAHAVRWEVVLGLGLSNAVGAGCACLVASLILVPISQRHRLPFAGVGFAAVVSMIPGIFLFRMGGGLLQIQQQGGAAPVALLGEVLANATTALLTIMAMALGLLLPISAYARFAEIYRAGK